MQLYLKDLKVYLIMFFMLLNQLHIEFVKLQYIFFNVQIVVFADLCQAIIEGRERIPHIGPLTKVFLDMVRGCYSRDFLALRVLVEENAKNKNGGPRFFLNESLKFLTHRRTCGRKTAQIYFVAVVLRSPMNFPKVRFFEVLSSDN